MIEAPERKIKKYLARNIHQPQGASPRLRHFWDWFTTASIPDLAPVRQVDILHQSPPARYTAEMNSIPITVNGELREVAPGTTVARLLQELNLQPRYLAVERNLQLVPRAAHAECVLESGDRIEIVTLVGGG
jgi:sulfur carrier protein